MTVKLKADGIYNKNVSHLVEYQVEHIKNPKNKLPEIMIVAVAIKCKDGIVIAADRQGTDDEIKEDVEKFIE